MFAPNGKRRESVVPKRKPGHETPDKPLAPMTPMQRLKRIFAIDIETCPKCGGKSGHFDALREVAEEYVFVLMALGLVE